jgi:hypothetical protein
VYKTIFWWKLFCAGLMGERIARNEKALAFIHLPQSQNNCID